MRTSWDEHHPARAAEQYEPQERGGSADHAARRIRGEPKEAKTSGAIVRVDKDGRDAEESEVARDRQGCVAVHLHRSRLQPLPIAKPGGQGMTRSVASGPFSS